MNDGAVVEFTALIVYLLSMMVALQNDFSENGETWENNTMASYLKALADTVSDMDRFCKNREVKVSWEEFTQILSAAIFYE